MIDSGHCEMGSRPIQLLILIGLVAFAGRTEALQIKYLHDARFVRADAYYISYFDSASPPYPFADFDDGAAAIEISASQQSSLTSTTMIGSGDVWSDTGGGQEGESRFEIGFRVDETALFDFTGTMLSWDGPGPPTVTEVRLFDSSGDLFSDAGNHQGTLFAGTDYTLVVGGLTETGEVEWSFDFAIVPEPSTALLLAAGLVILRGRRFVR
jgi:hypothetical protein